MFLYLIDRSIKISITKHYQTTVRNNLQFGILIPAGIPLLPNIRTSRLVKSGRKNTSFS